MIPECLIELTEPFFLKVIIGIGLLPASSVDYSKLLPAGNLMSVHFFSASSSSSKAIPLLQQDGGVGRPKVLK